MPLCGAGATPAVVVLLLSLFSLVIVKFLAMLATTSAVYQTAKEGRNMKTLVFASVVETIHAFGASNWASGPLAKGAYKQLPSSCESFRAVQLEQGLRDPRIENRA